MRARVISTACMRMPSRGVYVYAREPHTRVYVRGSYIDARTTGHGARTTAYGQYNKTMIM